MSAQLPAQTGALHGGGGGPSGDRQKVSEGACHLNTRAEKQDRVKDQIRSKFMGVSFTKEQDLITNRSQEGPARRHLHPNRGVKQEGGQGRHPDGDPETGQEGVKDTGEDQVSSDKRDKHGGKGDVAHGNQAP
mgnify:CR=1 FL=1